jgi:uncharacterized membrane protein HdeD (DUF308 family)
MAAGILLLLIAFFIFPSVDAFYNLFDFGIFLLVGGAALMVARSREANPDSSKG